MEETGGLGIEKLGTIVGGLTVGFTDVGDRVGDVKEGRNEGDRFGEVGRNDRINDGTEVDIIGTLEGVIEINEGACDSETIGLSVIGFVEDGFCEDMC